MLQVTALLILATYLDASRETWSYGLTEQGYSTKPGNNPVALFNACQSGDICATNSSCRYGICLPTNAPVAVYPTNSVKGNRSNIPGPSVTANTARVNTVVVKVPSLNIQPGSVQSSKAGCVPRCIGTASCVRGMCSCGTTAQYIPLSGCRPFSSSRPMMAVPIVPVQHLTQVLPGGSCDNASECTGGSECQSGRCICPSQLVHQGTVCVTPTIFGQIHKGLPGYTN